MDKKKLHHYYIELIDGKRQRVRDHILLAVLNIAGGVYGMAMRLRAFLFAIGVLRSRRLGLPVISVGNLTMGGTGKTPTVAFLACYFLAHGKRVAVLSRGYGGTCHGTTRIVSDGRTVALSAAEAGDEPYLLASTIPGLMVVIGPDRYQAGRLAEAQLQPDIFILDDGFQHQRLRRDLDILLLDCEKPHGNGKVFPAGQLREPPSAARRASLVIHTRCSGSLRDTESGKPFCRSFHQLAGLSLPGTVDRHPFSLIEGKRILAFAGIAAPARFFDALEAAGVKLITTLAFEDHAEYGEEEIAALVRLRDASRSSVLLTTEKDAVKLAPWMERLGTVYSVPLEIRFQDDRPLMERLEKFL